MLFGTDDVAAAADDDIGDGQLDFTFKLVDEMVSMINPFGAFRQSTHSIGL